jgi:hypothetical protein
MVSHENTYVKVVRVGSERRPVWLVVGVGCLGVGNRHWISHIKIYIRVESIAEKII